MIVANQKQHLWACNCTCNYCNSSTINDLLLPLQNQSNGNHSTVISTPNNCSSLITETTTTTSTTTTTTDLTVIFTTMRPNTLNVSRENKNNDINKFLSNVLRSWRAKARDHIVPADRLRQLFEDLHFYPTEKQINEMLQTAKKFARRGSNFTVRDSNGLTYYEFCLLASYLRRFRTSPHPNPSTYKNSSILYDSLPNLHTNHAVSSSANSSHQVDPLEISTNERENELTSAQNVPPEVFLGGSCNPTTWRADVAIPALNQFGISFYNPQVSDWTPDLIELEHRAKEKAQVLFFVMDSETRSSAGAIEAAHIAGQNSRHLVLVLHPYKQDQCILNEKISKQEYLDLRRNQRLLKELVTRRGLPVLDNIQSGLQRTRDILSGNSYPVLPHNIASILNSVHRAFESVLNHNLIENKISLEDAQRALSLLGYAQNLLTIQHLYEINCSNRYTTDESLKESDTTSSGFCVTASGRPTGMHSKDGELKINTNDSNDYSAILLDFRDFCMLTSVLSILQHNIHEPGCISPIKGTNVPPPPIFLTNTPEWLHNQTVLNETLTMTNTSFTKNIFRTSSCKSVPEDRIGGEMYRNRDSGTSSPQPMEQHPFVITTKTTTRKLTRKTSKIDKRTKILLDVHHVTSGDEERANDSDDSNDSVFSSGSSIDSSTYVDERIHCHDMRDFYLGGSCYLRTKWREDVIPLLEAKGLTYHLPQLHESIYTTQQSNDSNLEFDGKMKEKILVNEVQASSSGSSIKSEIPSPPVVNTGDENGFQQMPLTRKSMFNPGLLDSSRVLLFVITSETRSLAPMTLAAHCIGLGYNVVLCVQMLPEYCYIGNERLTPVAIKDYNRGRSYLIDLAKRQDVPVFSDLKATIDCAIETVNSSNSRNSI